jgi:hypothetical protein
LPWTKIDVVPAAQTGPTASGGFVDPVTGKVDPTLKTFKGQVQTPTVPSTVMVRYSLALRDPTYQYNEPYSGILMAQSGTQDNLIALRRSVFATSIPGSKMVGSNTVPAAVPNTALFALDSNGNAILDDPRFLVFDRDPNTAYDPTNPTKNILQDSHNLRVYHWLGLSPTWENSVDAGVTVEHQESNFAHTVLQTQVSRFDMIMPQYNLATRLPAYDSVNINGTNYTIPRITPLLQFKPTVVSNDPAAGQEALRPGEETDNAVAIAPDVYKTQYGLWSSAVVRTYPEGFTNANTANNKYSIGYPSNSNEVPGFSIYAYDPSSGGANEFSSGIENFDVYTYDNAVTLLGGTGSVYPFTAAALAANSRSGWLTNSLAKSLFTPYDILTGTGKIKASFDISEVGLNALPNDPNQDANRPNLPTLYIPNAPLAPSVDSGTNYPLSPVTGSQANPYDINSAFNLEWNSHPSMRPNIQRFIDTRVVANEDGTFSPLYPVTVANGVTNFQTKLADGSMMSRCRIVPGSETVTGPDQAPGDHYGHPIRYTRVTTNPGVNEYRIVYVDQQEPNTGGTNPQVTVGAYENAFNLGTSDISGFQIDSYNPDNFVSATLQPRFKAGYIQLNSDPTQPLPQGYSNGEGTTMVPFKIDYRFQFTGTLSPANVAPGVGASDTFAVDYDTRQLMQVLLTLRSLPQSNLPNPQIVTLKATATLKNVAR